MFTGHISSNLAISSVSDNEKIVDISILNTVRDTCCEFNRTWRSYISKYIHKVLVTWITSFKAFGFSFILKILQVCLIWM